MVVDGPHMDGLEKAGWKRIYRGLTSNNDVADAERYHSEYATGQLFPGLGVSGNGTYTTTSREYGQAFATANNRPGVLMEMALDPAARTVHIDALREENNAALAAVRAEIDQLVGGLTERMAGAQSVTEREQLMDQVIAEQQRLLAKRSALTDPGRYAASRGYDAIEVTDTRSGATDESYLVVLNRTATAVRYP